jgi:hypothetical protein
MHGKLFEKHYFLNLICVIILICGWLSSVVIFITAQDEPDSFMGYDVAGDNAYSNVPRKMDMPNSGLHGVKPLALLDDMMFWFGGLWHGKALALTIFCLSIIAAGVIFLINNHGISGDKINK